MLPSAPLTFAGDLAIPGGQDFRVALVPRGPLDPSLPLYEAPRATVVTYEWRWQTIIGSPIGPDAKPPVDPIISSTTFEFAKTLVAATTNASRWTIQSSRPAAGDTFTLRGASCRLSAETVPNLPATPEAGTWSADSLLKAQCRATTFAGRGNHSVIVEATKVTVRTQDQRTGVIRQRVFETGEWTKSNATKGNAIDHVRRIATIGSISQPSKLAYNGSLDATVRGAALLVTGSLQTPRAKGNVEWGAAFRREGDLDPLGPNGSFAVSPSGPSSVDIRGASFNAPDKSSPPVPAFPLGTAAAAALLAGTGLLGLAWRLRRLVQAACLPLFSRLTQSTAAEHLRRRALLELVARRPGIGIQEAARVLDVHWTIVNYHAKVLARQDLLNVRRCGRLTALFAPGLAADVQALLCALRRPQMMRLLALIEARPGWTQTEFARALGIDQSHVSRLLAELRALNAVQQQTLALGKRSYRLGSPALAALRQSA